MRTSSLACCSCTRPAALLQFALSGRLQLSTACMRNAQCHGCHKKSSADTTSVWSRSARSAAQCGSACCAGAAKAEQPAVLARVAAHLQCSGAACLPCAACWLVPQLCLPHAHLGNALPLPLAQHRAVSWWGEHTSTSSALRAARARWRRALAARWGEQLVSQAGCTGSCWKHAAGEL